MTNEQNPLLRRIDIVRAQLRAEAADEEAARKRVAYGLDKGRAAPRRDKVSKVRAEHLLEGDTRQKQAKAREARHANAPRDYHGRIIPPERR